MDEFKQYLHQHQAQLDTDEPSASVWEQVQARVQLQADQQGGDLNAGDSNETKSNAADSNAAAPNKAAAKARVIMMRQMIQWSAAACVMVLAGIGVWALMNKQVAQTPQQEQVVINDSTPITPSQPVVAPLIESAKTSVQTAFVKTPNANKSPIISNTKDQRQTALAALNQMENGFTQVINLQRGKISTTPMYAESASYFDEFKVQLAQLEEEEKQIKKDIQKKGLTDQQLDQLINLYQYKLTVLKQLQLEMNKTNNRFKQNRGPVDSTRAYFIQI